MDYGKALEYIDSFIDFEKIPRYSYASSFNLERMRTFLKELDNPHHSLKAIHIAGSKGKGSTCAILASILKEKGYSVGRYTSPHLLDARERIRIVSQAEPEGAIDKEEFIELVEKIKPAAERFRSHEKLGRLSFFEFLTACAFLYFREKKVDFAVLETGLGGRLDATNVAEPLVSGITSISMEHTDKLGASLEAIAKEKAGIIKPGTKVVSSPQENEVIDVIEEVCREKNAPLYKIGTDTIYSVTDLDENGLTFDVKGPDFSYDDLRLNLLGRHQAENAALAVTIARLIDQDIPDEIMRSALRDVSWPGRLQIISREPYVIFDGAQNTSSIKAALSSIKDAFRYKRLICVFGILSDKDIEGVARELEKAGDMLILTRPDTPRARDPIELRRYFTSSRLNIEIKERPEAALKYALMKADKDDLILATGSLYLIADLLPIWLTKV